jgi:hypothetical protein
MVQSRSSRGYRIHCLGVMTGNIGKKGNENDEQTSEVVVLDLWIEVIDHYLVLVSVIG